MTNQSAAMDEIAQYLQEMNFKESIVGGYNKEDVLMNIRKLNNKFQQMLEDSQKDYESMSQQVQETKGKEEQYESEIAELKEKCAKLEEELANAKKERVTKVSNLEDTRRVSRSILQKAKDEAKGLMQRTKEETNRLYWENKNKMDQELQEQQKILEYLDGTKSQWLNSLGFMENELDGLLKTLYSVKQTIQNDDTQREDRLTTSGAAAKSSMNSYHAPAPAPQEDEIDLEQEWQKVIQDMDLDIEGV